MINILTIRTHYPQWASKSGINQYVGYLDKHNFNVSELLVPMGDHLFPVQVRLLKDFVRKRIQTANNSVYNLNDFWAELSVFKRIWIEKIDIVQYCDSEHSLQYLPYWTKSGPYFKRKPVIIGMFHQPKSILKKIISPKLSCRLDHIILMSEEQKDFFLNDFAEERISVIPHGIDTAYYKPDYSKREKDKFKCITVGHWLRDYDVLERVAENLVHDSSIEFHIVSNMTLKKDLKNVVYHRNINDSELLDLYQGCNLLFMPFKDATANNAILEGMGCGLPVLTTDLPATREYLSSADVFFVKNNTVGNFKKNILALQESELKKLAGENSRKRALELSWQNVTKQYESLYYKLAENK